MKNPIFFLTSNFSPALVAEHDDMVGRLMKPGEAILSSLSAGPLDMLHAAVGISGEAGELESAFLPMRHELHEYLLFGEYRADVFDACVGPSIDLVRVLGVDFDNVIEEIGDHAFYATAMYRNLREAYPDAAAPGSMTNAEVLKVVALNAPLFRLQASKILMLVTLHAVISAEILDVVKKHVVYGRALDVVRLLGLLQDDSFVLRELLSHLSFGSLDEILHHNIRKLSKGDSAKGLKPRFGAEYSDAAAQTRADKEGKPE